MARIKELRVGGILIVETDGYIDWARFKNTPTTIVSASGHDHDATYYKTEESNAMFQAAEDRLISMQQQIDRLAYKYTGYIGGGASNGTNVNKYSTNNDTLSGLGGLLSHSPINVPGITSKEQGYMFNTNKTTTKFVYSTNTAVNITACPISIGGTLIDYAIQTKGYVTDGVNAWRKLDVVTDIWETKNNATSSSAGRPMLSSPIAGFTKATGDNVSYMYDYIKGTSSATVSFNTIGTPTGLVRNSLNGYWISDTGTNVKVNYLTQSVLQMPVFTAGFSNTNTVSTEFKGYVLSGSNSTLAQKLTWATETSVSAGSIIDLTGGSSIES
jgi:hypothetical protein